jgi:hypothetical protein
MRLSEQAHKRCLAWLTQPRNKASAVRFRYLIAMHKARFTFARRSRCGSHRSPLIAKATLRLHSTRLEFHNIPSFKLMHGSNNIGILLFPVTDKYLCLCTVVFGTFPGLHRPTQSTWTSWATPLTLTTSSCRNSCKHGISPEHYRGRSFRDRA